MNQESPNPREETERDKAFFGYLHSMLETLTLSSEDGGNKKSGGKLPVLACM